MNMHAHSLIPTFLSSFMKKAWRELRELIAGKPVKTESDPIRSVMKHMCQTDRYVPSAEQKQQQARWLKWQGFKRAGPPERRAPNASC